MNVCYHLSFALGFINWGSSIFDRLGKPIPKKNSKTKNYISSHLDTNYGIIVSVIPYFQIKQKIS